MASLSVTNTFVDGTVITASGHNQNFADIVNYINNRNSGSATWDFVSISTNSGVPLTVNNSSGSNSIAVFQDNGTAVFTVGDNGIITMNTIGTNGVLTLITDQTTGPEIILKEGATTRWLMGHDLGLDTDSFVIRDSTNGLNSLVTNNGIMTFIGQSAARIIRGTSNQTINSGNTDKIQFNSETYDVKSEYDPVTNFRFTASRAGKYIVTSTLLISAAGAGAFQFNIYKNGSQFSSSSYNPTGVVSFTATISDILDLAASDYIEMFGSATANNMSVAQNTSFLCIHKIA